ncbi:unnamed protein product [Prorocentrum cordatum]|uniref:Apple domain-containing protein n=1 Tax=Prorocentrum cordatum TaxID=2364126 RepID=A0ABN9YCL4_9DINO|nr:unnamed protein product [Polarella glacialis]
MRAPAPPRPGAAACGYLPVASCAPEDGPGVVRPSPAASGGDDASHPSAACCRPRARAFAAALLATLAAAAALVGRSCVRPAGVRAGAAGAGRLAAAPLLQWKQQVGCAAPEDNVEYLTPLGDGELYHVEHVMSPEDCRARCEAEPRCAMWTWGKTRDVAVAGTSDVCFLKELAELAALWKQTNDLAVSGLACRAPAGHHEGGAGDVLEPAARGAGTDPPAPADAAGAACQEVSDGVELRTSRSVDQVGRVADAAACRQLCEEDRECSLWTWGKAGSVDGLSSVCFLWALEAGEEPEQHLNPDAVSGARPSAITTTKPCDPSEDNVYYRTRGNLSVVGFVQSAHACGALCSAAPACGAWTWGKARARGGLSDVCFLKRLAAGEWPQKLAQDGVVSGYACRPDGGSAALGAADLAALGGPAEAPRAGAPAGQAPAAPPAAVAAEEAPGRSGAAAASSPAASRAAVPSGAAAPSGAASAGSRAVAPGGVAAASAHGGRAAGAAVGEGASGSGASGPAAAVSAQAGGVQSPLYCFQLMRPAGYEPGLVAYQFEKHASIFACDLWTLFSSRAMEVSPGLRTLPIKSDLRCETGGESGKFLNTDIFMAVWAEVISAGEFERASWTVKVDTRDCVFLPARLLPKLHGLEDGPRGAYLNNGALGMHGPLEVFSQNAVLTWAGGAERCTRRFQQLCGGPCAWGEETGSSTSACGRSSG